MTNPSAPSLQDLKNSPQRQMALDTKKKSRFYSKKEHWDAELSLNLDKKAQIIKVTTKNSLFSQSLVNATHFLKTFWLWKREASVISAS